MAQERSQKTVGEIKLLLKEATFEDLPGLIAPLEQDSREQIKKLVASTQKRYIKEAQERVRVEKMYDLMHTYGGNGVILGVDEVGRGPLAGPLVVCAVALPDSPLIWGINDSKQLTPQRREELAQIICERALAVGIAQIEPAQIDEDGMAHCLHTAMRMAVEDAHIAYDAVLIDGVPMHLGLNEIAIPQGDAKIAAIAAASIVAKVNRDAQLVAAQSRYPGYGFANNKGYGSAEHIAAIKQLGITDYHRKTFCHAFI
ncbi:MAG: ribonuclease HII [Coriobacteriales bacterium]|nr:ribonuclease HII [Coriobacteriales bacterium]